MIALARGIAEGMKSQRHRGRAGDDRPCDAPARQGDLPRTSPQDFRGDTKRGLALFPADILTSPNYFQSQGAGMKQNQEGTRRSSIGNALAIGLLISSISLAGCTTVSTSGADRWLTKSNFDRVDHAMAKKGMMPAAIDCRFDSTAPGKAAYGSKVTWKPVPRDIRWVMHVGTPDYVASSEAKSRAIGLHRVFSKRVRDKATGQVVQCTISTD